MVDDYAKGGTLRVSVIIPMYNEAAFIGPCLESFLPQIEGLGGAEILCVDGRSTDGTRDIVERYAQDHPCIRLIDNPERITPVALNRGLAEVRGRYVLIAGCHAEYADDYVENCLEVIERTGADQVGGYMTTLPRRDTPIGRAIAAATACRFGVGNARFRLQGPEQEVDTVAFGLFRREVFERIGGYDERLVRNQDIELSRRLLRSGGRTIISPRIRLRYYNQATFGGLFRQAFGNGQWGPYTIWLTGGGLSWRHFVPMAFVSSLLLLAVASVVYWPARVLLSVELAVYLATAVFFAIRCSRGRPDISAVHVLWAFIVTHVAYGLGSIWGVLTIPFRFPRRSRRQPGRPSVDRHSVDRSH